MRPSILLRLLVPLCVAALVGCAGSSDRRTLAELHEVEPDLAEVKVEDGLDQAMNAYRSFLEETPESALTPEAMRRLADLKIEKEYGILGDSGPASLPAPARHAAAEEEDDDDSEAAAPPAAMAAAKGEPSESDRDFERRAAAATPLASAPGSGDLELPGQEDVAWAGPLEAIALYDQILAAYPDYQHNDQVLYQKARAYDELGRNDEAIAVMERLITQFPDSRYIDEVQFRRGEYFFTRRKYLDAEDAYTAVTKMGVGSQYYELALYKLGWTLYKQELHEEALHQYIALLDYKVSTGYDFDQSEDEADERRIADTYRVVSLSFSSIGGPEAVQQYFEARGHRSYEDRIYSHLGEFYLEKLRYHDAAEVYRSFVTLYPLHRSSPHFSMRVVEIYQAGNFPKLVLESKKDFAARYGLQSDYWRHFDVNAAPEVLSYLKSNLKDLANHYHAQFQEPEQKEERSANFAEAQQWYRAYLASFPSDVETPPIHYQLADLLLEHEDFAEAAREYEHTAYDYPAHERAAAAGYAAIYAHREAQKVAKPAEADQARRDAVASSLRFVDTFPAHEHASAVLGAAADDLYDMKDFPLAKATARRIIDDYPEAEKGIRRSAWLVVGHASLDTDAYEEAETAYTQVLEMTPEDDEKRQDVVESLAASIYKQGEQANLALDHRAAADHFLRIKELAPSSKISAVAEYDAGAALIALEDWAGAAAVLEDFRQSHPDHELHREATKQMAFVYRQEGDLARAAEEYERVAKEAEEDELRREALLVAGELYEESDHADRALKVYLGYVEQFPRPLEEAVETRFKIAEMHGKAGDEAQRKAQLQKIVDIDRVAGVERSERVRYLAARSALALSEAYFERFDEVALTQPFEKNLQKKQQRMDAALAAFGALVDYEVGEVTAAATFYMAEVYLAFSKALMDSERPAGLSASELQDYEMVLEEEAFPFEERAIDVHEKNLELMGVGVYNAWIEKSLGQLAVLMPGRYAKFETSSGLIESIDHYAYRAPNAAPAPGDSIQSLDLDEDPDRSPDGPPSLDPETMPVPDAEEAPAAQPAPDPAEPGDLPAAVTG